MKKAYFEPEMVLTQIQLASLMTGSDRTLSGQVDGDEDGNFDSGGEDDGHSGDAKGNTIWEDEESIW